MLSPTCLCCGNNLLRHAHAGHVYWFCGHCYQEMPASFNSQDIQLSLSNRSLRKTPVLEVSKQINCHALCLASVGWEFGEAHSSR